MSTEARARCYHVTKVIAVAVIRRVIAIARCLVICRVFAFVKFLVIYSVFAIARFLVICRLFSIIRVFAVFIANREWIGVLKDIFIVFE